MFIQVPYRYSLRVSSWKGLPELKPERKQLKATDQCLVFWEVHFLHFNCQFFENGGTIHLSHEKTLITFHYTGWFIGILIMVYYNPYIPGKKKSPTYCKQPGFFSLLISVAVYLYIKRAMDSWFSPGSTATPIDLTTVGHRYRHRCSQPSPSSSWVFPAECGAHNPPRNDPLKPWGLNCTNCCH